MRVPVILRGGDVGRAWCRRVVRLARDQDAGCYGAQSEEGCWDVHYGRVGCLFVWAVLFEDELASRVSCRVVSCRIPRYTPSILLPTTHNQENPNLYNPPPSHVSTSSTEANTLAASPRPNFAPACPRTTSTTSPSPAQPRPARLAGFPPAASTAVCVCVCARPLDRQVRLAGAHLVLCQFSGVRGRGEERWGLGGLLIRYAIDTRDGDVGGLACELRVGDGALFGGWASAWGVMRG